MATINLQINLKTGEKGSTASKVEVRVNENDTVTTVKDKVAAAQLIAFPEHSLVLGGAKLDTTKTIKDLGVTEKSELDFVLEATEASVVSQLKQLLKSRDLTCDELGLLYCYKHGVSTNQALKTIGIEKQLKDFVEDRKEFVVESGKVSLIHDGTVIKPVSVAEQLTTILKESGPMDVAALSSKFASKFHVSLASAVHMRPAEFLQQAKGLVVDGQTVSLREARSAPWKAPRREFVPAVRAQTPPRARPAKATPALEQNEEMYQELHTKISSRSFNSKVAQTLSTVKQAVEAHCPLNVAEIVKGGSVANGTAIASCCDAELVVFVRGLPGSGHQKWLPPLLRSLAGVFANLEADVECAEDAVRVTMGQVTVDVRVSPAFKGYADTVQSLGRLGPQARKPYEPSFAKERTQFVSKQPGHVKVTIRLLKWWRDQQTWSCALTRPSNAVLELVAIYVAQQCGKTAQAQMVANCMSVLARFDQLRVVWSNFYDKSDAWAPLMMQKPLLMDPVNPFRNVADPQDFDARELQTVASKTHFFW